MLKNNLPLNVKVFVNMLITLSDRDRILLIDRFFLDKSLKVVSKNLGISDVTVKNIEDRLVKRIEESFKYVNM